MYGIITPLDVCKAMKREIAVRTMPNVRDGELPWSESGKDAVRQLLEGLQCLQKSDDTVAVINVEGFRATYVPGWV